MVSRGTCQCQPFGVSVLGPMLLNLFINDMDDGVGSALSKSGDDTKLWGVTDIAEGHDATQVDFDRLEKWTDRNLMKFSKEKYRVIHTISCTSLCWKEFTEKALRVLVEAKLTMGL